MTISRAALVWRLVDPRYRFVPAKVFLDGDVGVVDEAVNFARGVLRGVGYLGCVDDAAGAADARVGHVLSRFPARIEDSRTEQHAHRLATPGVSSYSDSASVEAPTETGNGSFDEIQLVDDALQVLDSETPNLWETGIVRRDIERPCVEMGGLNYHEAASSPEVDQWGVAIHRPAKAVREDDDW